MKDIIGLLEDHDLVQAEAGMIALVDQVKATSPDPVCELKLVDLRQRLQSGISHIQRRNPLTAVIRFRKALKVWSDG